MVFLTLITATLIATNPPKVVQAFDNERACLIIAAKLNNSTELSSKKATELGMKFVCMKPIDSSL